MNELLITVLNILFHRSCKRKLDKFPKEGFRQISKCQNILNTQNKIGHIVGIIIIIKILNIAIGFHRY